MLEFGLVGGRFPATPPRPSIDRITGLGHSKYPEIRPGSIAIIVPAELELVRRSSVAAVAARADRGEFEPRGPVGHSGDGVARLGGEPEELIIGLRRILA